MFLLTGSFDVDYLALSVVLAMANYFISVEHEKVVTVKKMKKVVIYVAKYEYT